MRVQKDRLLSEDGKPSAVTQLAAASQSPITQPGERRDGSRFYQEIRSSGKFTVKRQRPSQTRKSVDGLGFDLESPSAHNWARGQNAPAETGQGN